MQRISNVGTKERPGKFDCYEKAEPDEPYFTLLARDWSAPYLVKAWEALNRGDVLTAIDEMVAASRNTPTEIFSASGQEINSEKHMEALNCSESMELWRDSRVR
jgi:hypothetical protein